MDRLAFLAASAVCSSGDSAKIIGINRVFGFTSSRAVRMDHRVAPAAPRHRSFPPHGFFLEQERTAAERVVTSGLFFDEQGMPLAVFNVRFVEDTDDANGSSGRDSWPDRYALSRLSRNPEHIKLYNSGSFFDPAAIPPAEYPGIALALSPAAHVVVESHPRLVGEKAVRFRNLLAGTLEVALGLETVHPRILPLLNKRFALEHFVSAVAFLRERRMLARAFVLVKTPFVDEAEGLEAVKSAEFAFNCGANVVSLIPTRPGNGALDELMKTGEFVPPLLSFSALRQHNSSSATGKLSRILSESSRTESEPDT